ncbi:MAG: hypothetical protein ACLPZM_04840, partial [Thermoplasmata archaeon]
IVVAAATTFAFFVSSEEQINLNEQTQLHFKNLENVTIQSVNNTLGYTVPPLDVNAGTYPGNITLVLSSSDIYNTSITDISIGGDPAKSFCLDPGCNVSQPGDTPNFNEFPVAGGTTFLTLNPFSVTAVTVNDSAFFIQPFVFSKSVIQVQLGTSRGNEFVETLFPPISEFGIIFVTSYPVLDGTTAYQPHSATSPDATIDQWAWTVVSSLGPPDPDQGSFFGQEIQLPQPFALSPATYTITLTVSNTLGLEGTASETYPV